MARPDQQRQPRPLYGREDALGILMGAYDRVLAHDRVAVVSLRGEGGSGKTALLAHFANQLAERDGKAGPRFARGTADGPSELYQPVRDALRTILEADSRGARGLWKRLGDALLAAVPTWLGAIPVVGALLEGVILGVAAALRKSSRPVVDGQADRLIGLLRTHGGKRPLVLALDDLHKADEGTTNLLLKAAHELRDDGTRLLIVVAWRPGPATAGGGLPIQRRLRELAKHVHVEDVQLGRLAEPEVAAIITDLLGVRPPGAVTQMLLRHSEGVPLMVVERSRTLRQRLGEDPEVWTPARMEEVGLQTTERGTHAVLADQLDGLVAGERGENERRLLSLAAVLGPVVRAGTLVEFSDLTRADGHRALRSLVQRHGLLEPARTVAPDAYRFCHNLLSEHVLEQLQDDPYDYTRLHERAAELLERTPDPDPYTGRWARLVHHYREAGRTDAVLATLARASEAAYDGAAWREGVQHLAKQVLTWIGPGGDPASRARAFLVLAEVSQARQDFPAAVGAADQARVLAAATGDDWSLAGALVVLAGATTEDGRIKRAVQIEQLDRAAALYQRLLGADAERSLPRLLQARYTEAWVAMRRDDWAACDRSLAEAEAPLRSLDGLARGHDAAPLGWDDPMRWRARLAQLRGEALAEQGRWAEALEPLAEVRRLIKERGDTLGEAAALGWHGLALCRTGRMKEGLREVRAALEIERDRLGSREGAAKWLRRLGELYADRGELELAAETLWLARDLWDDLGHAEADDTAKALHAVRDRMGKREYARLRLGFDPAASRYGEFAFVWRLPVFGDHVRVILAPTGEGWEAIAVFNPGAYDDGKTMALLYRAMGQGDDGDEVSTIGLALSADGVAFGREPGPVLVMPKELERPGRPAPPDGPPRSSGVEDVRVVRFPDGLTLPDGSPLLDRFAATYNVYDGTVARAALAFSDDLRNWTGHRLLFPDTTELDQREHAPVPPGTPRDWAKSAVLLPEPINGRFWLYFGDTHIWAAHSRDLRHWRIVSRPVLSPRPGTSDFFDARLVEPGPPPVLRPDGILLVYNGAGGPDEDLRYAVGQALISRHDPTRVIARAAGPMVAATDPAAATGRVPNVVFATGLVWRDGVCYLYLGLADTLVGVAVTRQHDPSTAPS